MASNTNLTDDIRDELECTICAVELNDPKFIGPCNHTFCKECIESYWIARGRSNVIPCPQCREECPIPTQGAAALKNNFHIANIIEKYRHKPKQQQQQQGQQQQQQLQCTLCPSQAVRFCKKCDFHLCKGCMHKHHIDESTRDHELYGLCTSHGKGLFFCCQTCNQAICSACKVSDHMRGHHVVEIHHRFEELLSLIEIHSLEQTDVQSVLQGEREQLLRCHEILKQTSADADSRRATVRNTVTEKKTEAEALRQESRSLQRQIDALVKKKADVDAGTRRLDGDLDNLENEKQTVISDARGRFAGSLAKVEQHLRAIGDQSTKIEEKVAEGRAVRSTAEKIFDADNLENLTRINSELEQLVATVATGTDARSVIVAVKKSLHEVGAHLPADLVHHQANIPIPVVAKKLYTSLGKISDVRFPEHRPCRGVYSLQHMPDGRLVALGTSKGGSCGDTLFLTNDLEESPSASIISMGISPALDVAVTSSGNLIVARNTKPGIRVYEPHTGDYHDVNITYERMAMDEVRWVQTDEAGNMFVRSNIYPGLFAVDPSGRVIQHLTKNFDFVYGLAYCGRTRTLYVADNVKIRRFRWDGHILQEKPAWNDLGEAGLCFWDICIGSLGEVLTVGKMGNGKMGIFQVIDDERQVRFKEIKYEDGEERSYRGWVPRIVVRGDNLWLGNHKKVEMFKMS